MPCAKYVDTDKPDVLDSRRDTHKRDETLAKITTQKRRLVKVMRDVQSIIGELDALAKTV